MKRILFSFILTLVSAIHMTGCVQRNKQIRHNAEDGRNSVNERAENKIEKIPYDSVLTVSHEWKDSSCLFGRPSSREIEKWKRICEQNSDGEYTWLQFSPFKSIEQMLAVSDMCYICDSTYNDHTKGDDFILWRLSEFCPVPRESAGEYMRFQLLDEQIESLLDFDRNAFCVHDMNEHEYIEKTIEEMKARLVFKHLIPLLDKQLIPLFKYEDKMYWQYHEAHSRCFETLICTPSGSGTLTPLIFARIEKNDAIVRESSVTPFLFFLSEGKNNESTSMGSYAENYAEIVNKYLLMYSELSEVEEDPEFQLNYPLKQRQQVLTDEKNAFFRWLSSRNNISERLCGDLKIMFDYATNNALTYKLSMLDRLCKEYYPHNYE